MGNECLEYTSIEDMINKPFEVEGGEFKQCWALCRHIFSLMGKVLPNNVRDMVRVKSPSVGDVVLFNAGNEWHTGVVWPDCIHFIHARPPLDSNLKGPWIVEKKGITHPIYRKIIDGFFAIKD